jgi:hypothetical protein
MIRIEGIDARTSSPRWLWFGCLGNRFVVRADEKPTAFLELESAIRGRGELCLTSRRYFHFRLLKHSLK